MHPDDDAGKNRLYDMFSVSDLTVCQGSTVAIESNWFGVDAITVENRDKSIIYSAGSESLVHVRDVETMLTVIRQKLAVRAERRVRSVETGVSVSRKIRDIAEELICNNEK
jgi:predicted glycosyltransferase